MPPEEHTIAYVDRYYDIEPEWSALPREWYGHVEPAEWSVAIDPPLDPDDPFRWFDDVEAAIAFAREHATIVLVRLGSRDEAIYSAGSVRANQFVDGGGLDYPEWPPASWPDYRGPSHDPRALDPVALAASRERWHKERGVDPYPFWGEESGWVLVRSESGLVPFNTESRIVHLFEEDEARHMYGQMIEDGIPVLESVDLDPPNLIAILEALEREDVDRLLALCSLDEIADAWWRSALRWDAAHKAGRPHPDYHTDPDYWAVEVWLSELLLDHREDAARQLLRLMAERAPAGADLGYLGAGPIEDFVRSEDRLRWIEAEAKRSPNFRAALANVYPRSALSDDQNQRLRRAAEVD